jgi:hypothetical protein
MEMTLERVLPIVATMSEWKLGLMSEHALPQGAMVLVQTSVQKTEWRLEYVLFREAMVSERTSGTQSEL